MSSYLEIYLQKKKKEGEEKGERLLLCSISRADEMYSIFRDNNIGFVTEDNLHEFTSDEFNSLINELTERMSTILLDTAHIKESLPLISNKDSIADALDTIRTNKQYYQELMCERTTLMTLCSLFEDIDKDWSDFDKIYWKTT